MVPMKHVFILFQVFWNIRLAILCQLSISICWPLSSLKIQPAHQHVPHKCSGQILQTSLIPSSGKTPTDVSGVFAREDRAEVLHQSNAAWTYTGETLLKAMEWHGTYTRAGFAPGQWSSQASTQIAIVCLIETVSSWGQGQVTVVWACLPAVQLSLQ